MSALEGLSPYDLGRARGTATERAEPTEDDFDWCDDRTDPRLCGFTMRKDFARGMRDGARATEGT